MDNFDDIKGIWHSASVEDLPAPGEIQDLIRRYRSRMKKRKVRLMVAAVFVSMVMVVVLMIRPQSPVRYAANAIILFNWLFTLVSSYRSYRRAQRVEDQDNRAFLQYLEEGQRGRIRYYKYTLPVLLSLNSLALLVYTPLPVVGYVLLVAYLLVVWLVIIPRQFKKKQRHYEALREKLERISQQL
jgi:hypothetical protein